MLLKCFKWLQWVATKPAKILQSKIVCGKTKSNYTNSSAKYASPMIPFVSESIV